MRGAIRVSRRVRSAVRVSIPTSSFSTQSAPNVSSPWITIHGLTIALFTDDGSLPPQTIDVTCHASRINPTGYDVGQTVHARCDKHRSVLYFEQLYPI
jgi:hypothetical protein